jgi:hypothetical protein
MGFGKKTDFESGRTLDLDKTYKYIIKPAVEAAGLECIRANEIVHSGVIDVWMYEQLLNADVVVADLSTSNKNAYYELGVRHALKPYTTIIICEDGAKSFPFDVNHVLIRQYHHMGDGIDFGEVERFRDELKEAIVKIYSEDPRPKDSPVYTFLHDLTPPELAQAMKDVAEAVASTAPDGDDQEDTVDYSERMQEVDEAQEGGDFSTAKFLLTKLRNKMKEASRKAAQKAAEDTAKGGEQVEIKERPEPPYIIQRLALVTYKSKLPTPLAALEEARSLLMTLDPDTSNDTETLGLWGAVHKRLWEVTGDARHLNEAVRGYERGFYLRNDYYNGINLAYLLNVRASASCRLAEAAAPASAEAKTARADAISCFVHAAKVRREVLSICDTFLNTENLPDDQKYWVLATMAEAHLGVGEEAAAEQKLQEAFGIASAQWMKDSTQEQMDKLRLLLAYAPLKYITAEAV